MLSYRHSFHAGNHADVLKHCVLSLIIESLKVKEKPFIYHDTHSGAGRYDLQDSFAEKTGEYHEGIGRLWGRDCPQLLHSYLTAVKSLNANGNLRFYPGSPSIARLLLRRQDRMVFTELHSTDFPLLRREFGGDRRVTVYQGDGYKHLKAAMPPRERRGMVLIDPPYELDSEYQDAVNGILAAMKRWATGTYVLWYPVVFRRDIDALERQFKASGIRNILKIELSVTADSNGRGMTGSGLIVVNPPWKLQSNMNELLPWMLSCLAQDNGAYYQVEWLVSE